MDTDMPKVHRMIDGIGVAVTDEHRLACGAKPINTRAVRFPAYLRAFVSRNPEFAPCRRCWPDEAKD